MKPTHLADVSAWGQLDRTEVAVRLVSLLVGGATATCGITDLELARSAVDEADHLLIAAERDMFPRVAIDDTVLARALEVQRRLLPRPISITALIVAAAAERSGLVVLHHDDDFERIARVTGQPLERVG